MIISSDPVSTLFSEHDRAALIGSLTHLTTLSDPEIRIDGIKDIDEIDNMTIIRTLMRVTIGLHDAVGKSNREIIKLSTRLLECLASNDLLTSEVRTLHDMLSALKEDPTLQDEALTAVTNIATGYGSEGTFEDDDTPAYIFSKNELRLAISDAIFSYNNM
jgi:hypothetical protein